MIGISGAQGGGKSTLLAELKRRGFTVDELKVSRAVQQELGWDKLDAVMESWDGMTTFQQKVFERKLQNDDESSCQFTERTFADIAAYTALWTWKHVDRRNVGLSDGIAWLHRFTNRCFDAQKIYEGTLLLPFDPTVVKWEHDAHRAARSDVDAVFESVQRFFSHPSLLAHKSLTITAKSVQDRADTVESFLRKLGKL